jgi:hypothetical protein
VSANRAGSATQEKMRARHPIVSKTLKHFDPVAVASTLPYEERERLLIKAPVLIHESSN